MVVFFQSPCHQPINCLPMICAIIKALLFKPPLILGVLFTKRLLWKHHEGVNSLCESSQLWCASEDKVWWQRITLQFGLSSLCCPRPPRKDCWLCATNMQPGSQDFFVGPDCAHIEEQLLVKIPRVSGIGSVVYSAYHVKTTWLRGISSQGPSEEPCALMPGI